MDLCGTRAGSRTDDNTVVLLLSVQRRSGTGVVVASQEANDSDGSNHYKSQRVS